MDKRSATFFVNQIFHFIDGNSLVSIKQLLEQFQHDQCITVTNSTIHGCTPLFLAVKLNRLEIARYLLEISLRQGRREMNECWKKCRHPFTAAILVGNMELVELISRQIDNINDYVIGPYTPLMMTVFNGEVCYVRMIVDMGADVNLPCFHGGSPLMASIFNSEVCRFLLGTDVNIDHRDKDGFTALHVAVSGMHIDSLKALVEAGADVKIRSKDGMTPLMLSAVNVNVPALLFLSEHPMYDELDKIQAMEALNACSLLAGESDVSFWIRALEMRQSGLPKDRPLAMNEALDCVQEFSTESELFRLQENPLQLAFQAVLTLERILGRSNSTYIHSLLQTSLIAKRNNLEKFRQLLDHAQKSCLFLTICNIAICSRSFRNVFNEIVADGDSESFFKNGGFAIFEMIARITGEVWILRKDQYSSTPYVEDCHYNETVDTFLYMAHKIKNLNLSDDQVHTLFDVVSRLVKIDPRTVALQSLLHRAIKASKKLEWGSLALVRLLVKAGADVDSKDYFRRTPLMYALKHAPNSILRDVVSVLMEYGSHLDCRNSEGISAMDFARWRTLAITPRDPLNLQCQAAHVIINRQITYGGVVPKILNDFVNLHQ